MPNRGCCSASLEPRFPTAPCGPSRAGSPGPARSYFPQPRAGDSPPGSFATTTAGAPYPRPAGRHHGRRRSDREIPKGRPDPLQIRGGEMKPGPVPFAALLAAGRSGQNGRNSATPPRPAHHATPRRRMTANPREIPTRGTRIQPPAAAGTGCDQRHAPAHAIKERRPGHVADRGPGCPTR